MVSDGFEQGTLDPYWKAWTVGTGKLAVEPGMLRCMLSPDASGTTRPQYSDAQITDYQGLPRRAFPWQPPLRLTVRAWASHPSRHLVGTAGFGFWNEPFVPVGKQWPRLPRATWFFFSSPPNNMALAHGVPGWGWKAATIDGSRWQFLSLVPAAPVGFLLMRIPALYRLLWPVGQSALGVSEAPVPAELAQPHTYQLDWLPDSVIFRVDGNTFHTANTSPRGPLGFILWIDNQFAVVTPQGRFDFGVLTLQQKQWLTVEHIDIRKL